MNQTISKLENEIGYVFSNKSFLYDALTHSSYVNERKLPKQKCNERLEFLGDAVLELVTSEYLFRENSRMPEGDLSKLRASIVCEPSLALCARQIHLGSFLRLGKGEDSTGGRKRDSVTSDALEALIGAIYMDGGMEPARKFIETVILGDLENKKLFYDSKTILQEIIQSQKKGELVYRQTGEEGPDHNKVFSCVVYIDEKPYGTGRGRSKKLAEQEAAYQTILMLRKQEQACI